jgi:cbb3-type cytochrome oxidase subunit 3
MKFIHYLTSITGVEIFPLISLLIFFVFFVALLVYAFKADKSRLKYLSNLPIERDGNDELNKP